jgi:RNA polymerase sigma-70 factor (ECF subfamily)
MKIKSQNHMVNRQTGDFDEETLVRKCQENDMGAFKMIFQHHSPVMFRTAVRILRNEQDAEDVVQITFLNVFRNINRFQFRSKFSTYLYRILINNCYDSLKKKRVPVDSLEHDAPGMNPLPGQAAELESAIQKLPRRMKTCFVLFAVEEFKQEEIARILDLKLGTVKATIFRAKQHLRRILADPAKEGQA